MQPLCKSPDQYGRVTYDYRRAQFCMHTGYVKLFLFGSFMLVRLVDGSPYL
jgi:hypothetical protein